MRTAALLLLFAMLGACADPAQRPEPWRGPTYTRAGLANLPTAQLAAMLLSAERAARVQSHLVRASVFHEGRDLQAIDFYQRPYPLAPDICLRERIFIGFRPVGPYRARSAALDLPARVDRVEVIPEIGLLPGCAEIPGRRFASLDSELSLGEGVQILRNLAAVRALAEGTQPLPFRLRCIRLRGEEADCTQEDRAALAAMPLHTAYEVQRRPGPGSCQPDDRLGGDLVLFDRENAGYWRVRMMRLGGPDATVLLSADGRRLACL